MEDYVIEINNLTKSYGKLKALDDVSLSVPKGQIYGLVGKNGAGKTTLMRVLSNQTIGENGEVLLFGENTSRGLNKMRHRTGTMIEIPSFYPFLTAKENLEYYRQQRGIAGRNCVEEVLEIVELKDAGKKKFKNFSLGMKQRLGLALALMNHPELLILDEPVNGLDPEGIVQFRNILLKMNREHEVTILISSHILAELQNLATHYTFMDHGKIVQDISQKDLSAISREHIEIKVDSSEHAVTVLEQKLGCINYEVLPDQLIRVYEYLGQPDVIAEALVKNDVRLFAMKENQLKLEEYFIELVGGEQDV